MRVDQNEATANPESRRTFLTRVVMLGVAAAMASGVAKTEAAPITGAVNNPPDVSVDKEMAQMGQEGSRRSVVAAASTRR